MTGKIRTMGLAVVVLLFCAAQSIAAADPQTQAANNPELAEAARLSASIVQLFSEGKYKEALPLAKRALQIREKLLNSDDERLNETLANLAEVYLALGRYDDARESLERVMKSLERSAPNQPSLAEILERLAVVQFATGYPAKTEELYKRALEINERALGAEHPKVARSVFLLAEFYQVAGDFKKAEPLYKRLLTIREKTSPPTSPDELREAVDRYGCLLRKLNREDEVRELRVRVYGTETLGPNSGIASGGVLNSKAIRLPGPPYPEEARASQVSGTVVVQVIVDESGNVIRACVVSGPPLFAAVSERAAGGAKFAPGLLNGKPVKVSGVLVYNFVRR